MLLAVAALQAQVHYPAADLLGKRARPGLWIISASKVNCCIACCCLLMTLRLYRPRCTTLHQTCWTSALI